VHCDWLADDKAIFGELSDGLSGVGLGDFLSFVGIEPNLALSAVENRRREALLSAKVDPAKDNLLAMCFCGDKRNVPQIHRIADSGETIRVFR
jgi:hypothetical protein